MAPPLYIYVDPSNNPGATLLQTDALPINETKLDTELKGAKLNSALFCPPFS